MDQLWRAASGHAAHDWSALTVWTSISANPRWSGIVGAGGIGATLDTAFNRYEFDSAAAILLIIIGIVMLAEYSSGYVRRWVQ